MELQPRQREALQEFRRRQALAARPEIFVQTLTEKLLTYALGRGLGPADMPAVRTIVRDAGRDGYRFSALATGIARSAPFRMRSRSSAPASADTRITTR